MCFRRSCANEQPIITLSGEKIADVNLATFYVIHKESVKAPQAGMPLAVWRGCRGLEPAEPKGESLRGVAAAAARREELAAGAR